MTNQRVLVAAVCALLAVATSAGAQDGSAPQSALAGVEVTPYVFLGSGASSGLGGAVRWPLPGPFSLELETSYRRSDVAALSSNLSLLYDFPEVGRVTPYLAAGVGLDQYAFADSAPSGIIVPHNGTAFSVNAGGGLRVRGNETWGMRSDARWINGIGNRAPEKWRLYNGVTFAPGGR